MQKTKKKQGILWATVALLAIVAISLLALGGTMTRPEPAFAASSQQMHRLYNPNSGEHFYTASEGERDSLVSVGWNYEGEAWTAPLKSNTPVYRLYSGTDHHYTTSAGERDALVAAGWSYEDIGWYSDDAQGVPLYRQFNPYVDPSAPTNNSGSHNYTTSKAENDQLVSIGWHEEGIGWYGTKAEQQGSAAVVNAASDFEYKVGNFIRGNVVETISFEEFKRSASSIESACGGCAFSYSMSNGIGGFSDSGYNCGYGVYITGYKGSSQNVIVPRDINGVPVVYADLAHLSCNKDACDCISVVDVARCNALKTFCCEAPQNIKTGANSSIVDVMLLSGENMSNLDLSGLANLETLHFTFAFPASWSLNVRNLRSFNSNGGYLSSLNLAGAAKLEEVFLPGGGLTSNSLNLTGCISLRSLIIPDNQLTSFDVTGFPSLTCLDLSNNCIADTSALEAWLSVPGHEGSVLPQRK